jgi:hypothetical protein
MRYVLQERSVKGGIKIEGGGSGHGLIQPGARSGGAGRVGDPDFDRSVNVDILRRNRDSSELVTVGEPVLKAADNFGTLI